MELTSIEMQTTRETQRVEPTTSRATCVPPEEGIVLGRTREKRRVVIDAVEKSFRRDCRIVRKR
jgi:hypothetical protein